jgi:hypothetical protein
VIEALLADLAPLVKTILARSFANLMLQRTTLKTCSTKSRITRTAMTNTCVIVDAVAGQNSVPRWSPTKADAAGGKDFEEIALDVLQVRLWTVITFVLGLATYCSGV